MTDWVPDETQVSGFVSAVWKWVKRPVEQGFSSFFDIKIGKNEEKPCSNVNPFLHSARGGYPIKNIVKISVVFYIKI